MAKKNKNKAVNEPLVSNAPLMDADLSAETASAQKNTYKKNNKANNNKNAQKPKLGARIKRAFKENLKKYLGLRQKRRCLCLASFWRSYSFSWS